MNQPEPTCTAPTAWTPPTPGKRWEGDEVGGPPPIATLLEEVGCLEILQELEANEVFTLDTLMLLTDADLAASFSPHAQMRLQQILGKSVHHHHIGMAQSNVMMPPCEAQTQQHHMQNPMPVVHCPPTHLSPAQQNGFIDMVQQLVEEREKMRRIKDYSKADAIREKLRKQGVKLNDDARTWLHPNGMHFFERLLEKPPFPYRNDRRYLGEAGCESEVKRTLSGGGGKKKRLE